jgi:hypothetical protein
MHVIRHQTIAEHLYCMLTAMVGKTSEVDRAVGVRKENRFAAISTLRNMVRNAGNNGPCNPGHGRS